jgi:hypothetical protein
MTGTTLDVAIGLVFIFMLFSLFLSTALEAVASALKLRARALEITIAQLIQDPSAIPFGANGAAKGVFGFLDWLYKLKERIRIKAGGPPAALLADRVDPAQPERHEGPTEGPDDIVVSAPLRFADVYEHPLVGAIPGQRPSYVPAKNFTSALLYVIGAGGQGNLQTDLEQGIAALPQGQMRTALTTALHEAEGDMDKLREGVERWYDNAMDRLSGEYKRFSQAALFLFALVLAATFDIDAIRIAERLYVDSTLRGAISSMAVTYVDQHPNGPPAVPVPPAHGAEQAPESGAPHQPQGATPTASEPKLPATTSAPAAAPSNPSPSATPASADADVAALTARLEAIKAAQRPLDDVLGLFRSDQPGAKKAPPKPPFWQELRIKPLTAIGDLLSMAIGLLATALAGMLGAPFWFDILQRLVNLRGSGPKPSAGKAGK